MVKLLGGSQTDVAEEVSFDQLGVSSPEAQIIGRFLEVFNRCSAFQAKAVDSELDAEVLLKNEGGLILSDLGECIFAYLAQETGQSASQVAIGYSGSGSGQIDRREDGSVHFSMTTYEPAGRKSTYVELNSKGQPTLITYNHFGDGQVNIRTQVEKVSYLKRALREVELFAVGLVACQYEVSVGKMNGIQEYSCRHNDGTK